MKNNESPTLSIVIPVYNAGKYISETIDSIISQDFKDFEIIAVDDGSTDNSYEICRTLAQKDDRIKLLRQVNQGVSVARNHGIENSAGKYIFFIDADDCLYSGSLTRLVNAVESNNADIGFGKTTKGRIYKDSYGNAHFKTYVFESRELIPKIFYQHKFTNDIWGRIYRKELFKNVRFRENIRFEDLDIFYKLYEKAKNAVFIDCPTYFYRQHEESFISRWSDSKLDVLDVTDRIERHYQSTPYKNAAKDRKLSANFNILSLIYKNQIKKADIENRCWGNIKSLRMTSFFNPKVRLKNKIGIILSFGGRRLLRILSKLY